MDFHFFKLLNNGTQERLQMKATSKLQEIEKQEVLLQTLAPMESNSQIKTK